MVPIPMTLNEP